MKKLPIKQLCILAAMLCASSLSYAQSWVCVTDADLDGVPYGPILWVRSNTCSFLDFSCLNSVRASCVANGGTTNSGEDNCPLVANANQLNTDGDAEGDACDTDDDNDGVADVSDNCPLNANPSQANFDGDSQGDACDSDDDNDGVNDNLDAFPSDGCASVDTDGDGLPDQYRGCFFEGFESIVSTDLINNGWKKGNWNPPFGNFYFYVNSSSPANLQITLVIYAPVTLSFYYGSPSTPTVNKFFINGVSQILNATGYNNWLQFIELLSSGTYTLRWEGDCYFPVSSEYCQSGSQQEFAIDDIRIGATSLVTDLDDDNDGVADTADKFPLDSTESLDTDNDSIGNNADWDDDNDGVPDTVDAEPLNAANSSEITLPLDGNYKGRMMNSESVKQ